MPSALTRFIVLENIKDYKQWIDLFNIGETIQASQRCLVEDDGDCLDPLVLVHPLVDVEVVQPLPPLQLGKVALDRVQLGSRGLVQVCGDILFVKSLKSEKIVLTSVLRHFPQVFS